MIDWWVVRQLEAGLSRVNLLLSKRNWRRYEQWKLIKSNFSSQNKLVRVFKGKPMWFVLMVKNHRKTTRRLEGGENSRKEKEDFWIKQKEEGLNWKIKKTHYLSRTQCSVKNKWGELSLICWLSSWVEILVLFGLFSKWGMGISLTEAGIPLGSASVKIFTCTGKKWNFWPFFLYLDAGRLVGELEMNICISLARAREKSSRLNLED